MTTVARKIMEDLRQARVLVVHPRDEDGAMLLEHLKRLGCEVKAVWPLPSVLPKGIDTLFIHIEDIQIDQFIELVEDSDPAVIAVLAYESPVSLKTVIDINAHGVISKPLRALGILTQFTLARYRHRHEKRLAGKVFKLEETLKGRRLVDKAIRILMDLQTLTEDGAYRLLREQATSRRLTMPAVAQTIITAYDTMNGLGLKLSPNSSTT